MWCQDGDVILLQKIVEPRSGKARQTACALDVTRGLPCDTGKIKTLGIIEQFFPIFPVGGNWRGRVILDMQKVNSGGGRFFLFNGRSCQFRSNLDGKVSGVEYRRGARGCNGALNRAKELSNISRPLIPREGVEKILGKPFEGYSVLIAKPCDVVDSQVLDVFGVGPQAGKLNYH